MLRQFWRDWFYLPQVNITAGTVQEQNTPKRSNRVATSYITAGTDRLFLQDLSGRCLDCGGQNGS